jgi:alkylation response protein AidB-like acyl-CoA dehydrogenase
VVHLRRERREVRDPDRQHRGQPEIRRRQLAFLVDLPSEGWTVVRDVATMAGHHNHAEIRIENLRVPRENMLGGRGQGTCSARRGSARRASRTACAGSARPRSRST